MGGRGSAPNPAEGAHSAPPDPFARGEGLAAPPENIHPTLGLRPSVLVPPVKNPGHALRWWNIHGVMRGNGLVMKKKNIYFANSKNNYNTNIMCKHRGGFPEGQSPIVQDTLSNAEYNIKYLKKEQFTIYYRSTIMNIH